MHLSKPSGPEAAEPEQDSPRCSVLLQLLLTEIRRRDKSSRANQTHELGMTALTPPPAPRLLLSSPVCCSCSRTNSAVRGPVARWQTCRRSGQLDKCSEVAELIPVLSLRPATQERRAGDARRREGSEERKEGRARQDRERVTFRGIMSL